MQARILLVAGIAMATLLAGCSGGSDDTSTTTSGGITSGTESGLPGNTPPAGSLRASATTGTAPVDVTFTIEGSDADGDALTYTLDFGDGETANGPLSGTATADHNYQVGGNFTARVTIHDTKQGSVSATVTLRLDAGDNPITQYECEVLVGAEAISFNGVGGCNLTTLDADLYYSTAEIPGGCTIQYDANADNMSDGEATLGEQYESGVAFFAFCGPGVSMVTVRAGFTERPMAV